jgi:hypothetical protein
MHDVNPLGQLMHLKEIERQLAKARGPFRPRTESARPRALRAIVVAVLRRFGAFPGQAEAPASLRARG